jgi:hypothetical protein
MHLRIVREEPGHVELAPVPNDRSARALTGLALNMVIASAPAAVALVAGLAKGGWAWGLVALGNAYFAWMLWGERVGRLTFARGQVTFVTRRQWFAGAERTDSVPLANGRLEARVGRDGEAILTLRTDPPGPLPVFSVAGVFSPADVEDFKAKVGLPSSGRVVSATLDASECLGAPPGPCRTLARDEGVFEYSMPQSRGQLAVSLAFVLGTGAVAAAALRMSSAASVAAGVELATATMLGAGLIALASGNLRFRVDGTRRELIDLRRWSRARIPFDRIQAVVIHELAPGRWLVTLLHEHESLISAALRSDGEPGAVRALAAEIARRIGVPVLERRLGARLEPAIAPSSPATEPAGSVPPTARAEAAPKRHERPRSAARRAPLDRISIPP